MTAQNIPNFHAPEQLKTRRQWLVWRLEPGKPKPRKVPYYATGSRRSGEQGGDADRARLVDHATAVEAARTLGMTGIGFAFLPDDGLIGIDLDHMAEDGVLSDRALRIVESVDSYAELSPSRTGVHIIAEGTTTTSRIPGDVELFCGRQFFTWTGEHVYSPDTVTPIRPDVLDMLHRTIAAGKKSGTPTRGSTDTSKRSAASDAPELPLHGESPAELAQRAADALSVLPPDTDHETWIRIGMALHSLGPVGFELWDTWSAAGSKYPGRQDLDKRWASFKPGGVSIPTLFFLAGQHGWSPPADAIPKKNPTQLGSKRADALASIAPRPMGYDRESMYFYAPEARQVITMGSATLNTASGLISLAPLATWQAAYPAPRGNQVDVHAAADDLIRACRAKGPYDPARIRGRGAWIDNGVPVVHMGDHILAPDGRHDLDAWSSKSHYTYEAAPAMSLDLSQPASEATRIAIAGLAEDFRWACDSSSWLLAGWVALAPVCGMLGWRPHLWITGPTGCGKSTVMEHYIRPLMGGSLVMAQGGSTEAGIRQALQMDAYPVLIDEAEQQDQKEQIRMQAVLALARQASSETGSDILRGTVSGSGLRFKVRSMFAFAAIGPALRLAADRNRIAVLEMARPDRTEGAPDRWLALKRRLAAITETTGQQLAAYMVSHAAQLIEAVATFTRAAAGHMGTQRLGDTYGTLLAGAWVMRTGVAPTEDEALHVLRSMRWPSAEEALMDEDEPVALLNHLLAQFVRVGSTDRALGELVRVAANGSGESGLTAWEAHETLARFGIRVERGCMIVANVHAQIDQLLKNSPYHGCHSAMIRRIDGVAAVPTTRFGGSRSRGLAVPLQAFAP